MKFIADFHIHSRYSRATSPKTDIHNLAMWAKIKGVDVLGTGDCTHGEWLKHVKEVLIPAEQGLYRLKDSINDVRFIITGEISCIYKKNDKVRKVHILIIMSSIEAAERLNVTLMSIGANLRSDGRPIIGLDTKELLKMCLEADSKCLFVPAHCFTPWFGIFGSKSGFDSLDECFEEMSPHVLAVESGLSSDPPMIWRIPDGERLAIISNSDAHSGEKIGREANVFDTELSYDAIYEAIKDRDVKRFLYTLEFYPEEGKYHFDGHRACGLSLSPEESREYGEICPICGKRVTVGVLNRVDKLASQKEGYVPQRAIPFKKLVPLKEVIAESLGCGEGTKKVSIKYDEMISLFHDEFNILLNVSLGNLSSVSERIAEGISRMRSGNLSIIPGYDGEFGVVSVFTDPTPSRPIAGQKKLI